MLTIVYVNRVAIKHKCFIVVALSEFVLTHKTSAKRIIVSLDTFLYRAVCVRLQLMCLVSRWCTTDIKHQQLLTAQAPTGQRQNNGLSDISLSSAQQISHR